MIVPQEQYCGYLGRDINSLAGRVRKPVLGKLNAYNEITMSQYDLPVLDYLFLAQQQGNVGMEKLSQKTDVERKALKRVFNLLGFPTLTHHEAVQRGVELGLGMYGANEDRVLYTTIGSRNGGIAAGNMTARLGTGLHGVNPVTGERYVIIGARKGGNVSRSRRVGVHGIDRRTGERYVVIGGRKGGMMKSIRHGKDRKFVQLSEKEGKRILDAYDRLILTTGDVGQLIGSISSATGLQNRQVRYFLSAYLDAY